MKETKKQKLESKVKQNFPFTIHSYNPFKPPAFPTHTHGLTKIGFPELIMDPLAFGPANINIIKRFYLTLKQEGSKDLKSVLNGEILRFDNPNSSTIFCLREVPSSFEGIKCAYEHDSEKANELENAKFLQIWVEGDDYVLMDSYYINGVTW